MIKIPVGKSCFILLTPEEYRAGIARGKAFRRRKAFEEREEKRHGIEPRRADVQRAIRFNDLLVRFRALQAENNRLRRELALALADRDHWRRAAYRGQETAG